MTVHVETVNAPGNTTAALIEPRIVTAGECTPGVPYISDSTDGLPLVGHQQICHGTKS